MEIDSTPVPPPQEYSDNPNSYQTESSLNFDYLETLNNIVGNGGGGGGGGGVSSGGGGSSSNASNHRIIDTTMDSSSSSPFYQNSPRHFSGIGTSTASTSQTSYGHVDDSKVIDRPFNLNERFVTVLDQLDARVEKFRKDALGLQEKRDFLLMSIDLIKSNDLLQNMAESEREEIGCYLHRVNARLSTVELNVRTVRDNSQEDSLSQINSLIDAMITMGDPVMSRQRCQQYLNSCCSSAETNRLSTCPETHDIDAGPVDKVFESALLGCTLDDQKNIKKRLHALMGYLNKQIIRN